MPLKENLFDSVHVDNIIKLYMRKTVLIDFRLLDANHMFLCAFIKPCIAPTSLYMAGNSGKNESLSLTPHVGTSVGRRLENSVSWGT